MAEKKKKVLKVSPVGIAVFPRVTGTPDTKFDDAGVWKTGLRLSGADAEALKSEIDDVMATALVDAKKKVAADAKEKGKKAKEVKAADAPYSEEESGDVVFNFKMKASGVREDKSTWERRPKVFDRLGKLIMDAKLGGGSKIQVSYELSPFYTALVGAGVSLRLEAVRVLELVEWGDANAESFGFDVDEPEEGEAAEETESEDGEDDF